MHNNVQIQQRALRTSIRDARNRELSIATCSTDDSNNKDGETTRGHWLEHHEHSASSVATLTKAETAAQSRGPTVAPWPVMLVLDCFTTNANLTHSCCDVHECMFSAIISVAYAHCPVTVM